MASDDPESGFSITTDDSSTPSEQNAAPRRSFLKMSLGAIIIALVGYFSWTRYFFPPGSPALNGGKLDASTAGHVPLGSMSQFTASSVPVAVTYDGREAFVDAKSGSPLVLSGVCTHAGCSVTWDTKSGKYLCGCHGSQFGRDGSVLRGPATLPLHKILSSIDGNTLYADG